MGMGWRRGRSDGQGRMQVWERNQWVCFLTNDTPSGLQQGPSTTHGMDDR